MLCEGKHSKSCTGSGILIFVYASAFTLSATAVLKLLEAVDPYSNGLVLNSVALRTRTFEVAVAMIEVMVSLFLYTSPSLSRRLTACLVIGIAFLTFHWLGDSFEPGSRCGCLGALGSWGGLDSKSEESLALGIASVLVVGSVISLGVVQYTRLFAPEQSRVPKERES